MNSKFYDSFIILIKGFLMGCADIVPGVSGGTIALIVGIYERLVNSISKINFSFLKPLFKGNFHEFKVSLLDEVDFSLFIPLLLGIGIAFLTLAKVISYAMDVYTAFTYSFFLGLILASAYILLKKIDSFSWKHLISAIVGCVFAYIFVSLNPIAANHSLPVIFVSGLIAICAMILPGISGSFLLLLLGQYEYMLGVLKSFQFTEMIVFCIGALIGILGFSKILNYLLENYEEITMAFLIGIMVGTLKLSAVNIIATCSLTITGIGSCLIFALIGLFLIIILENNFSNNN